MPKTCCCVPLCNSRGGHVLPKDPTLRKKWLINIRREKWVPTKSSVVCSRHFTSEDYISSTWRGGIAPLKKVLCKNAVPSIFAWTQLSSKEAEERRNRWEKRKSLSLQQELSRPIQEKSAEPLQDCCVADHVIPSDDTTEENTDDTPLESAVSFKTVETQTETSCNMVTQMTQTRRFVPFSVSNFEQNVDMLHFYTGLENFTKFKFVFDTLGPAVYHLNYVNGPPPPHLDMLDLFFLNLIILRRNATYREISFMFSTTVAQVSNIFNTWIRFMYLQWQEIDLWPTKETVQVTMPGDFKRKYPTTRLIMDTTEFPIVKPSLPTAQQATFSNYKNKNTVKCLVGSSPGGLISYISPCFGGATSDRQIMERSRLAEKFDFGDSVMADKGFDIQDMLVPYGVKINIPTFFKKMNRLPSEKLRRDRQIASKRVHIERLIGLGKTFKILVSPLHAAHISLSSEIVFICYMLCNFRKNIVHRNA